MIENTLKWLKERVSPIFVVMILASFALWYTSKLGYTYTTDIDVQVKLGSQRFEVPCVVEGVGTNLFGYQVYKRPKVAISPSKITYQIVEEGAQISTIAIDEQSLKNAIAVEFSDIKVLSVAQPPRIKMANRELLKR